MKTDLKTFTIPPPEKGTPGQPPGPPAPPVHPAIGAFYTKTATPHLCKSDF